MIEVKALCKTFAVPKKKTQPTEGTVVLDPREVGSQFHALRNVSFSSKPGQIIGLLGPNGAGKTTLLRILSTAIQPTSGTCVVNGIDSVSDPLGVRRKIGFLSGSTGLYGRLTPREILLYFGKLHEVPKAQLERRIEELFTTLGIGAYAHRRSDGLSTGMKQKVNIARAVVHDPEVLVFDEPTTGLDVLAAQTILNFMDQSRAKGKSIIFSTHHMTEVERLCEEVVMIYQGQCRFSGTVAEMKALTGQAVLSNAFLALMDQEVPHAQ